MTATQRVGAAQQSGIGRAGAPIGGRFQGMSGIEALDPSCHEPWLRGWLPLENRWAGILGPSPIPSGHGLDPIEQKVPVRRPMAGMTRGEFHRLATLSVAIPFAAVFVLACLTL